MHIDQDEGQALPGREGREGTVDVDPQLGGCRLVAALGWVEVVQRGGRAGGPPPDPVEAGVDHDPVQPGRDGRVAAEAVGPAVGGQQRLLDSVGGLLAVAERAQRDGPESVPVPPDQLAEGVRVSGHVGRQELGVVPAARPTRDVGRRGRSAHRSLTSSTSAR